MDNKWLVQTWWFQKDFWVWLKRAVKNCYFGKENWFCHEQLWLCYGLQSVSKTVFNFYWLTHLLSTHPLTHPSIHPSIHPPTHQYESFHPPKPETTLQAHLPLHHPHSECTHMSLSTKILHICMLEIDNPQIGSHGCLVSIVRWQDIFKVFTVSNIKLGKLKLMKRCTPKVAGCKALCKGSGDFKFMWWMPVLGMNCLKDGPLFVKDFPHAWDWIFAGFRNFKAKI